MVHGTAEMLEGHQVVRFTPERCQGTDEFQVRAYDREAPEDGLYSAIATATITIQNVAPDITWMDSSDGTVAHNYDITRDFTDSDACSSLDALSVTASHTGSGAMVAFDSVPLPPPPDCGWN